MPEQYGDDERTPCETELDGLGYSGEAYGKAAENDAYSYTEENGNEIGLVESGGLVSNCIGRIKNGGFGND